MNKLSIALQILAFVAIAMTFAVIIVEAAYGCGTVFTDAEGVKHMGECIWLRK